MALTTIEPFGINSNNTFTFGGVTATGNVTANNVLVGNTVSVVGNISANYVLGNGTQLTGVLTTASSANAELLSGTTLSSNVVSSSLTAVGNLISLSVVGNIDAGNVLGNLTGNVTGNVLGNLTGEVVTSSQPNITAVGTLDSLSVTGNIDAGNVTTGVVTADDVSVANVFATTISATGNITSLLVNTTDIFASSINTTDFLTTNVAATTVTSTTLSATGNVDAGNAAIGGTLTAVTLSGTTVSVTGNVNSANAEIIGTLTAGTLLGNVLSAIGNVNAGNAAIGGTLTAVTLSGTTVSATGNVNAANVTATLVNIGTGNLDAGNVNTVFLTAIGNVNAGNFGTTGTISAGGNVVSANLNTGLITATTGNITDVNASVVVATANVSAGNVISLGTISAAGNLAAGNITTSIIDATVVSATGNITANYFVGNGSQLTGLPESYSNANVAAYLPTYTGNLVALTGNVITTANISGNYFIGNGSLLTGMYSNTDVAAYLPTYTGNLVALTGNVTTTANVSANYFLGNGSQLTGIQAGATTTFSSTAPVSPAQGDIWIDADTAVQYIYFNDGTSNQWAEMEAQTSIASGADLSSVAQDIIPSADVTYDLGSSSYRWRDLYLSGNTINLGGATIKTDAASGAIALIPEPTEANPNPSGMVVSPSGGITVVATTGGEVSGNAIANAAASPTAAPVPIDITTTPPTNGQALIWDSANEEFVPGNVGGGGTPGGANTQIQFNNDGAFGGTANLTWSGTTLGVIGAANISADVTVGNILTDGYYYANGEPFAGGGGATTTVYGNIGSLPLANVTTGSMAFVSGNNRLYLWNGTGWFNIALINTNPSITSGPDASYVFATDGTPTVLTLVAEDPEGFPITWSYQVTSGSLGNTATIVQADNVFTITPSNSPDYSGSFSVTFTASDGVNIATAASSFTLSFPPTWTLPFINQQVKLQASDAQATDNFGYSVAISGDTLVVGARLEDSVTTDAGSAYIFTRSGTTWTQQAKIQASDAQATDYFGHSVAISGDTLVVGAHLEDPVTTNAGSAYIFTRSGTTWTQQAKLVASDPEANDQFGQSVAIDGDTVVVGSHQEYPGGLTLAGSAYIFTRSGTTWTQQAKLVASDAQASDYFGHSVAIDGDTVVVGARLEDPGAISDAGSAYIFTRSGTTWTQQAKIQASDAQASDQFGWDVAIDGDTVVVGAYLEDTGASDAGSAYIFTRSGTTWTQQQKIQASDAQATDWFGHSVAIDGDTVVVGAHLEDTVAASAGAAYIFTRSGTTWTQQSKIQASDPENSDWFGWDVAIDGDTVVVGAQQEDTVGADAGAAYVFKANINYQTGAATSGQQLFTTPGTYSWTAPEGVTAVSVVAIGGGGAGGAAYWAGGGGGGGGVGWKSRITVVPGSSYTVEVGAGGIGVTANAGGIGTPGGDSYFIDNTVVLGGGGGAGQGTSDNTNVNRAGGAGGTFVGDGGSAGGAGGTSSGDTAGGGGGAGGYNGSAYLGPETTMAALTGRGVGLSVTFAAPFNGGGGAGGQSGNPTAGSGGGVGALGAGTNGSVASAGGSGGTAGGAVGAVGAGGLYGGGGGGQAADGKNTSSSNGGNGAVRIIWGAGRAYPSTNTADV